MKSEAKVGLLFVASVVLVLGFAAVLGLINPFQSSYRLNVMYNYAGGIEQGSPVRLMGIKVGKVKSISFKPDQKTKDGEEVKLLIAIDIEKSAWPSIRQDSQFYINLAGVIGEKFLEISPGSSASPEFSSGDSVRGEDPPRVDQLISQGYGLAGKILSIVEKNEGTVVNTLDQLDRLLTNFNKTLALLDKTTQNKDMNRLLTNSVKISDDLAYLTGQLRSQKSQDSFELLNKLLFRLEPLDAKAIKKFLQEEGVKARVF